MLARGHQAQGEDQVKLTTWMVEKTTRISELVNSMLSYDRPDLGIAQSSVNLTHRHIIAISRDAQGCWRDKVFLERLWRSVKYEEV